MRSVELFAGAGGLGLGVSRAGFVPAVVIERNRYCCDTIRENKGRGLWPLTEWPLWEGDIQDFRYDDIRVEIDLVSGGPPCQPFSLGGKHRGHTDDRDMFPEAVRAVRALRPRAFLFENVKGLTRDAFASYLEYVKLQLSYPELECREDESWLEHLRRLERHHSSVPYGGLQYKLLVEILDAADYGVPQRRDRVFFVGFRRDLGIEWSFPTATHSHDALLWEQGQSGDYWKRHQVPHAKRLISERLNRRSIQLRAKPDTAPWRTVRDAIHDLPDPELGLRGSLAYRNHKLQPGARTYPGHSGSPLDEPAKTLKAGVHGVPGGENMLVRPDGRVRYFTVRESARLQTFPDDFLFHGTWTETMRQLGNAAPVTLVELLARDIRRQLDSCGVAAAAA
ncbi:MAG: DNA cytosine methyltransferase [Alphaproteobacteria bacterium]